MKIIVVTVPNPKGQEPYTNLVLVLEDGRKIPFKLVFPSDFIKLLDVISASK
jgi:hypothetical protein